MDDFGELMVDVANNGFVEESKKSGKNANSTVEKYGIKFDSLEELHVYEWVEEAKQIGFFSDVIYQPASFELYAGLKNSKGKFVVRPHVYTADYKIKATDKWVKFVNDNKIKILNDFYSDGYLYIDVKGQFNKYSGDREFSINHKFMLSVFNIYVWKIVPKKLFEKTWLPKNCMFTLKTHKISKKYENIKTFEHKSFIL